MSLHFVLKLIFAHNEKVVGIEERRKMLRQSFAESNKSLLRNGESSDVRMNKSIFALLHF